MNNPLWKESGGTGDDRRSEADKLLRMLDECDMEEMSPSDRNFLEKMYDDEQQPISPRQLFWLRDIKDRYF